MTTSAFVAELERWGPREAYAPPPREEAAAAQQHYADRVKGAFSSAGESVADVGKQLGDWLKKVSERPPTDEE